MKTAPRLDEELGDALHAYADRIPAAPDTARLLAALDAAPLVLAGRRPPSRVMVSSVAAGIAVLLGAGTVALAMNTTDKAEDPVVKVTGVVPTSAAEPSAAPTTAEPAPTTVPPATVAPTTLPPTTVALAPPAVQAAPPAAVVPQAAVPQQVASAAPAAKKKAATAAAATQKPAAGQPPPPAAASVGFSAAAAFGSCGEDPPYDIYSGTADPGSRITIASAYGGGSATADGNGHWEKKVVFASAPIGETFSVSVSSAQGSDTFDFTRSG